LCTSGVRKTGPETGEIEERKELVNIGSFEAKNRFYTKQRRSTGAGKKTVTDRNERKVLEVISRAKEVVVVKDNNQFACKATVKSRMTTIRQRYREACLEDELAALQARNKELVRRLESLQAAFASVHQTYINSILNGQVVWQAQ